nr:MAG: hypothetical protein [Molluscum contagiosum virus]
MESEAISLSLSLAQCTPSRALARSSPESPALCYALSRGAGAQFLAHSGVPTLYSLRKLMDQRNWSCESLKGTTMMSLPCRYSSAFSKTRLHTKKCPRVISSR